VPIQRSIQFANKFPDQILDKTQLQRFLGCVNYVSDFIPNLSDLLKPLYARLNKNPTPWTDTHTSVVKTIKLKVKHLPFLSRSDPSAFKSVETDSSDLVTEVF
jgi:hypothetical protein